MMIGSQSVTAASSIADKMKIEDLDIFYGSFQAMK